MKFQNPGDALFRLIKSMSRKEKLFFQRLCMRRESSKGKIYFKLFQAIDGQIESNEPLLKNKFKEQGLQFAETKRYLYAEVIDALVQYNLGNADKSLYQYLFEAEVLLDKGLFDLYELLLFKLRSIAVEKNDFLVVLETLLREKRLLIMKFRDADGERLKEIRKQEVHYNSLHSEVEDYIQLLVEILPFKNKYSKIASSKFLDFAKRSLFKDHGKPRSVMAQRLLYNLRAEYYRILGDFQLSFNEYYKEVELVESNPRFQYSNPKITLAAFMNCAISCLDLKRYDNALEYVEKCKKFVTRYPSLLNNRMLSISSYELAIYRQTRRYKNALALVEDVKEKIEKREYISDQKRIILFYLNSAFVCLDMKENQLSQKLLNWIINFPDVQKTNFLFYYNARVLQLINIYELKQYELLESRLRAFRRFVLKQGPLNGVDKSFLNFFGKVFESNYLDTPRELKRMRTQLKTSIEHALNDSAEGGAYLFLPDFLNWLKSN